MSERTQDVEGLDRRTPNTHRAQLRKSMERVRANESGGEAFWQELDSWAAYLDQQEAEIRRLRSELEEANEYAEQMEMARSEEKGLRLEAEAELERRDAALRKAEIEIKAWVKSYGMDESAESTLDTNPTEPSPQEGTNPQRRV